MNQNPTQAEMDAFNAKWDSKKNELFTVPEKSETQIQYEKSLGKTERKKYTKDEAKKIFFDRICSVSLIDQKTVAKFIKEDLDYQRAANCLVDLIFSYQGGEIEGKGGIYLASEPGVGKTTLMASAVNVSNVINLVTHNPNFNLWQNMRVDISQKLKGKNEDLTYIQESNLYLDEFTEKINQVSHYGDYKYSLNEVIQNRYDLWKSKGYYTVIGSNLFEPVLFEMLDQRSISRFKEQYLVINMLGANKRKS
ncbi:MAG: hypothetical protein IPO78_17800 [Saprospiraceae bacterium]|nr:hypothetical protein [Saprospiraceae bacterium]